MASPSNVFLSTDVSAKTKPLDLQKRAEDCLDQVSVGKTATPALSAQQIRQHREKLGWTRAELAARSGLCASTIRNIEMGRHRPTSPTANAVSMALTAGSKPTDPGFALVHNPIRPVPDQLALRRALSGVGGYLEPSLVLADPLCASVAMALRNRQDIEEQRLLFTDIAQILYRVSQGQPFDIWLLGCSDGKHEIALIECLLAAGFGDLRVLLIEESSCLLDLATQHAVTQLGNEKGVSLRSVQMGLSDLPLICFGRTTRRQLFCLLAPRFGLCDGEIGMLRQALTHARPSDLLLLGFERIPCRHTNTQDKLWAELEAIGNSGTNQPLLHRLAEQVFRRHEPTVQKMIVDAVLDQATCSVPASYAVTLRVKICAADGISKTFSLWRSKRYESQRLAETLFAEGYGLVKKWQDDKPSPPSALHLYARLAPEDGCARETPDSGGFYGSRHTLSQLMADEVLLGPDIWLDGQGTVIHEITAAKKPKSRLTLCLAVETLRCQAVARPSALRHQTDSEKSVARLLLGK